AWIRSPGSFVQRTLSARATFGSGPWEHVGFGADGFADRWAIVSTADTSATVYARTFNGSVELRTPLAGVAPGAPHDGKGVWQPTKVDYYVDGALSASHALAIGGPMYVYASNDGAGALSLAWLRVDSYSSGGTATYVSGAKDVGVSVAWGTLAWTASVPAGA